MPVRCAYTPHMQLYIDTANLNEIKQAADMGILDGVTTNPSLVSKEGVDFHKRLKEICEVVKGPVSAEVVSITHDEMIREAEPLIKIAPNIVIKLPCISEGLKACKTLSDRGEADVVVMGVLARGRVKEWLIGSTAERVLHGVPIDVLAVKPAQPH